MIRIPGFPQPLKPCLERPPVSGDAGAYGYPNRQNHQNRQPGNKLPNGKKWS